MQHQSTLYNVSALNATPAMQCNVSALNVTLVHVMQCQCTLCNVSALNANPVMQCNISPLYATSVHLMQPSHKPLQCTQGYVQAMAALQCKHNKNYVYIDLPQLCRMCTSAHICLVRKISGVRLFIIIYTVYAAGILI